MVFCIGFQASSNILLNILLFSPMILGISLGFMLSFCGGIGLMSNKKWSKTISLSGIWISLLLILYYTVFSIWLACDNIDAGIIILWIIAIFEILSAISVMRKILIYHD